MPNHSALENEALESLRLQVKKLTALIDDSTMPENIKDAWLSILPNMDPVQLDELLAVLEAKYLDEQTGFIDNDFKGRMENVLIEYKWKEDELDNKFREDLKKFGDTLSK